MSERLKTILLCMVCVHSVGSAKKIQISYYDLFSYTVRSSES